MRLKRPIKTQECREHIQQIALCGEVIRRTHVLQRWAPVSGPDSSSPPCPNAWCDGCFGVLHSFLRSTQFTHVFAGSVCLCAHMCLCGYGFVQCM